MERASLAVMILSFNEFRNYASCMYDVCVRQLERVESGCQWNTGNKFNFGILGVLLK